MNCYNHIDHPVEVINQLYNVLITNIDPYYGL